MHIHIVLWFLWYGRICVSQTAEPGKMSSWYDRQRAIKMKFKGQVGTSKSAVYKSWRYEWLCAKDLLKRQAQLCSC